MLHQRKVVIAVVGRDFRVRAKISQVINPGKIGDHRYQFGVHPQVKTIDCLRADAVSGEDPVGAFFGIEQHQREAFHLEVLAQTLGQQIIEFIEAADVGRSAGQREHAAMDHVPTAKLFGIAFKLQTGEHTIGANGGDFAK